MLAHIPQICWFLLVLWRSVRVHKLPSVPTVRAAWTSAVPRKHFSPTKYTVVSICSVFILGFQPNSLRQHSAQCIRARVDNRWVECRTHNKWVSPPVFRACKFYIPPTYCLRVHGYICACLRACKFLVELHIWNFFLNFSCDIYYYRITWRRHLTRTSR